MFPPFITTAGYDQFSDETKNSLETFTASIPSMTDPMQSSSILAFTQKHTHTRSIGPHSSQLTPKRSSSKKAEAKKRVVNRASSIERTNNNNKKYII